MPTSHRNASFDAYSDGIAPFAQPVFAHLRDLCVFAAYRNQCAPSPSTRTR